MLADDRKNTTNTFCRPSWAPVCRSRMQQPIAVCTRAETLIRTCPCAACIWLLHPAPTSPKMVLTFCNWCWWCFSFQQLTQKHNLHSWWSLPATCTGGVSTCPFTGVHKNIWTRIALHCERVLNYIYVVNWNLLGI